VIGKTGSSGVVQATMHPSGKQFTCLPDQSLLESGLGAGIALPFGCANGSCGDCRARIRKGSVTKIRPHDFTLTDSQKLDGQCLLCSFAAETDIDIEVYEAQSVNDIPQQQLQAKPLRRERVDNVDLVSFKFVRGKALRFLPGQRATVQFSDGTTTTLAIANCPCNAQIVEFHLFNQTDTTQANITINERIDQSFTSRKPVTISGPTGSFTLTTDRHKPKLFYALGGDFSQLQGMVEQVLNTEIAVPCCLLWQATNETTHYRANLCRSWHDAFDNFTFVALENGALPFAQLSTAWNTSIQECEIYLGGEYQAVITELIQAGVAPTSIFYPTINNH